MAALIINRLEEKQQIDSNVSLTNTASEPCNPQWTFEDEKKLVRRIDFRILPMLMILYILNYIDRSNFANARLQGLEKDLDLTDVQYQTCIIILLVGYVCCQIPSNIFLNSISRPSLYLSTCVCIWGMICASTAAVHNAAGAIMCRFFVGCVEAAFVPGVLYYLSRWYTRKEMQLRVTILNAGNLAAQAFGGLIAAGILDGMEGKAGIRAWRWLFIIEGALTMFIAMLAPFVLPEYPTSTSWLSKQEKAIAMTRLVRDTGIVDDDDKGTGKFHGLHQAVTDPKVWALGITYFFTAMGLSFSFVFPTITAALGYNTVNTLLLTAPPWIWAIIVSMANAWHADRTGERFFHFLGPALTCITGYIISIACTSVTPRYFACFLMTTGYASAFVNLAWISNIISRPPAKRAAAIAIVNAMGNTGIIPGSYIWRAEYGPLYRKPFGAMVAILGFACVCGFRLRQYLIFLNRKLDREEEVGYENCANVVEQTAKSQTEGVEAVQEGVKRFRYLY